MKLTYPTIGIALIAGSLGITALTSGGAAVDRASASLQGDIDYSLTANQSRTDARRQAREGAMAFELIAEQDCSPVYGLNPRRSEPGQPFYIQVPLEQGAIATVGGRERDTFAKGSLLCDSAGRIGRVGDGGRVEYPIDVSEPRLGLPVVPAEFVGRFNERHDWLQSEVAAHRLPQAVVSTTAELNPVAPVPHQPPVTRPIVQPTPTPIAPTFAPPVQ